ncbi:Poly [ADP-ribose] polymerase 2, variant 2 [Clonorchis sinensis]|nr:Poly [ADP-ribose] polymerase 2, variant 2 [Clonorchis sinensis]
MLNQTNVQHNNNKYYVIQLLEDDNAPNYSVWFRWGRVGKNGQNKLEKFGGNLQDAVDCFKQKFYDKTLNDWDCVDQFVKVNGKYDLVKLDYGTASQEQNIAPLNVEEKSQHVVESLLPKSVQLLIQLICDLKSMEDTMMELKYDARRAPLGKLTKDQVKAGYTALKKIADCIASLNTPESSTVSDTGAKKSKRSKTNASERKNLEHSLLTACNEFYTRIPHDFGMRVPPLLRTMDEVKEKLELLEALDDIEFAVNMMKKDKKPTQNLIDSQYQRLECELKPIESDHPMYTIVRDYLCVNRGATHNWYELELLDIFECTKKSEAKQFKNYGNQMLLWHGSRLTNWVGILGRGLKVAPPEAPVTGYMFGKGIYFADCSSKSANYAYPTQKKNVGLMALCEVSLGKVNELYQACHNAHQLPEGMHSVKGVGRVAPEELTWSKLDGDVTVPIGKLVPSPEANSENLALQFNEYVVYDPNQVRLRYLVKMRFNFC